MRRRSNLTSAVVSTIKNTGTGNSYKLQLVTSLKSYLDTDSETEVDSMDESAFESESLSDPFSSLSDSILGFFLLRRLTPDSTAIWKSRQEVESMPNISKQRGGGSRREHVVPGGTI